jgi:hypothetical protein
MKDKNKNYAGSGLPFSSREVEKGTILIEMDITDSEVEKRGS